MVLRVHDFGLGVQGTWFGEYEVHSFGVQDT